MWIYRSGLTTLAMQPESFPLISHGCRNSTMNWRNHVVPTLRTPCTCLATFLRGPPFRGPLSSCPRLCECMENRQARGHTHMRERPKLGAVSCRTVLLKQLRHASSKSGNYTSWEWGMRAHLQSIHVTRPSACVAQWGWTVPSCDSPHVRLSPAPYRSRRKRASPPLSDARITALS